MEGVVCGLARADEAAVFGHDVAVGVGVDLVAYKGAGKEGFVSWRIAIVNRGCGKEGAADEGGSSWGRMRNGRRDERGIT